MERLQVRDNRFGAVSGAGGALGLVYGLGSSQSNGWDDIRTLGPVVVGGLLLIAFVLIECRVSHPLLPLRVVLDRGRGAAYLSVGISGAGSFAVFLFLTYYLEETLHFTPIQTGAAFLPMVGLLVVGAIVSGGASGRTTPVWRRQWSTPPSRSAGRSARRSSARSPRSPSPAPHGASRCRTRIGDPRRLPPGVLDRRGGLPRRRDPGRAPLPPRPLPVLTH